MDEIQQQADDESVNWKEENAQLKAKVNAYETVLKSKNMRIKKLIKELDLRNAQLKQFQKSYRAMKEVAKRLTVVRDEKDNDFEELSASNEKLSTELNEVNEMLYDVNQEVDKLQKELDDALEELEEVRGELNETKDDFNDQQDELDEVQKELDDVKDELEEVKDELKEVSA